MASDTQKHSTQIHTQKYLPKNVRQKNSDCTVKLNPKNLIYKKGKKEPEVNYIYYVCVYVYTHT